MRPTSVQARRAWKGHLLLALLPLALALLISLPWERHGGWMRRAAQAYIIPGMRADAAAPACSAPMRASFAHASSSCNTASWLQMLPLGGLVRL